MDYKRHEQTGEVIPVYAQDEILVVKAAFQEHIFTTDGEIPEGIKDFFKACVHSSPAIIEDFIPEGDVMHQLDQFNRNTPFAISEMRENPRLAPYKESLGDIFERQDLGDKALKLLTEMGRLSALFLENEQSNLAGEAASPDALNALFELEGPEADVSPGEV